MRNAITNQTTKILTSADLRWMYPAKTTKGWLLTRGALILLTVIDASLALSMRHSRTIAAQLEDSNEGYIISTAVICAEVVKMMSSAVLASLEGLSAKELFQLIVNKESVVMAIPAVLYAVQNNLQYWAATFLDAPVQQVLYKLKIVTTALLSVVILRKQLSVMHWIALLLCMAGASITQLSMMDQDGTFSKDSSEITLPVAGLIAVLCACTTSALAAVYIESILKRGGVSIWVRNFQLSFFCLTSACAGAAYRDGKDILERGFFVGYTPLVWLTILLVSGGGLTVAVVTRYTDSIVKNVAPACSIILSCTLSIKLFGFKPNSQFVIGAILTLCSVWMYVTAKPPQPADSQNQASSRFVAWKLRTKLFQQIIALALIGLMVCGGLVISKRGPVSQVPTDSTAAFLLRTATDPLPHSSKAANGNVAVYGSVLTEDNSPLVLKGIVDVDKYYDGNVSLIVLNCTNSALVHKIPGMMEGPKFWNMISPNLMSRSKMQMIPWPHQDINTLNEMQVVISHLQKNRAEIDTLVLISAPFHLPRALLTTLKVVKQLEANITVFAHASDVHDQQDFWGREVTHSQGLVHGKRVDLIATELKRIKHYSSKGDILKPAEALVAMSRRDMNLPMFG